MIMFQWPGEKVPRFNAEAFPGKWRWYNRNDIDIKLENKTHKICRVGDWLIVDDHGDFFMNLSYLEDYKD